MTDARNIKAPTPSEFRGVQALRGLAACMVVVYHATQLWSSHVGGGWGTWLNGQAGVDIFFVISGFVMTVSTANKRGGPHPARDFLERRLVRIVPLYWLMTALTLLKLYAVHVRPQMENAGPHAALSFSYITSSLLFLPVRNSLGVVQPVLATGWTLTFEMFFYILFACALALRISEARVLTPIMVGLAILGLWHGEFAWSAGTLASPLLLEFLAGVLIGRAVEARWRMRASSGVGLAMVCTAAILTLPPGYLFGGGRLFLGGLAGVLVYSVAMVEAHVGSSVPRWTLAVGDASYSLYLGHLLFYAVITKLLGRLGLLAVGHTHFISEVETVLLLALPAIGGSLLLYRWIEAPVNNALRRRLKLRNARLQPSA